MTLANAMVLIDQTAVPLALPDIGHDLHASSLLVQWGASTRACRRWPGSRSSADGSATSSVAAGSS